MHFIPIPSTPKAIFDKVKIDSGKDFHLWPKGAAQAQWIQFKGNSLSEVKIWLQANCVQKVEFVDENTDNARKALNLITAADYKAYKKVSDLIAGKSLHLFPKFTAAKAEKALAGFERTNPAEQPVVFEVTEGNLTLHGTVTPNNKVNILLELHEESVITGQYNFQVPANLAAFHFKPLLTKYLTDTNFTYAQGKVCLDNYIAAAQKREQEQE